MLDTKSYVQCFCVKKVYEVDLIS